MIKWLKGKYCCNSVIIMIETLSGIKDTLPHRNIHFEFLQLRELKSLITSSSTDKFQCIIFLLLSLKPRLVIFKINATHNHFNDHCIALRSFAWKQIFYSSDIAFIVINTTSNSWIKRGKGMGKKPDRRVPIHLLLECPQGQELS